MLTNDLGGDVSYQVASLVRRCVHLERLIERAELALANGAKVNESTYLNAINVLVGLFGKIGLQRRARSLDLATEIALSQRHARIDARPHATDEQDPA